MSQTPRLRRARQLTVSLLPVRPADGYGNLVAGRLQKLATSGSTGMLPFSGSGEGAIYFRDGRIVHAESGRTPGPADAFPAQAGELPPLGFSSTSCLTGPRPTWRWPGTTSGRLSLISRSEGQTNGIIKPTAADKRAARAHYPRDRARGSAPGDPRPGLTRVPSEGRSISRAFRSEFVRGVTAEVFVVLLDPGDVLFGPPLNLLQVWILVVRVDQAGRLVVARLSRRN